MSTTTYPSSTSLRKNYSECAPQHLSISESTLLLEKLSNWKKQSYAVYKVDEIKNLGLEHAETEVLCQVTLRDLKPMTTWCKPICTRCYDDADLVAGVWTCTRCIRSLPYADKWFEVYTVVADETGDIQVLLENKELRTLIGKTAFDLIQEENNELILPNLLRALINKKVTVKLLVTELNVIKNLGLEHAETEVLCQVTLRDLKPMTTWCKPICTRCYDDADLVAGVWTCTRCIRSLPYADKWFEVYTVVADETGDIQVLLENKELRTLIGKTAFDLIQEENNELILPNLLRALINKKVTVKLLVTELNVIKNLGLEHAETEVLCQVTLRDLKPMTTWCKPICTRCYDDADLVAGVWTCTRCIRSLPYADKWFEVYTVVADETGDIQVLLENKELRTLIGKTAFDLIQEENNELILPNLLRALINKKVTVKLLVTELNVIKKNHLYVATNIMEGYNFEMNDEKEENYPHPIESMGQEPSESA